MEKYTLADKQLLDVRKRETIKVINAPECTIRFSISASLEVANGISTSHNGSKHINIDRAKKIK